MSELESFLKAAKSQGASDEFLVNLLQDQGWPPSEIYAALGRHYAESTGVPLPQAPSRLEAAREAFFHLLAFVTLGAWIFSAGSLWFELIDTWFPDPAMTGYRDWRWSRVSWQMAAIIVAFPAFVFATRTILAEMARNPDKAVSPIRRWLTNIALLITALVFIGDLVAFVASFLQGELTVRFVLKCLTVFLLAGAVFLYYNRGVSQTADAASNWNRGFAIAAAAAILLSLGLGFLKAGSPGDRRTRAEDRRRVEDLHTIASRMHSHWDSQNPSIGAKLPPTLTELSSGTGGSLPLSDPFTRAPYTYYPLNGSNYRLCAVFSTSNAEPAAARQPAWTHPAGPHCYDLDALKAPAYPGSQH